MGSSRQRARWTRDQQPIIIQHSSQLDPSSSHLIQFEITRIILSRERGTDLHFHNLSVPDKMKCRVIAPVFTRDGVRLRRGGHSPEKILAPIRRRPLLSSLCAPSKCDPMTGKYFTREKYLDVLEKISHLWSVQIGVEAIKVPFHFVDEEISWCRAINKQTNTSPKLNWYLRLWMSPPKI